MSLRVAKVESLIQQVVATSLRDELGPDSPFVTVTRVDAAPDLRNATVWLGVLGKDKDHSQKLFDEAVQKIGPLQHELAQHMTMKYAPRLHFKLDGGGEYAQEIEQVFKRI